MALPSCQGDAHFAGTRACSAALTRLTNHHFLCCFNVLCEFLLTPDAAGVTQCSRRASAFVRYFFAPCRRWKLCAARCTRKLRRPAICPQPSRAKTIETADNAFFPRLAPPTRPPCSVAPSGGKTLRSRLQRKARKTRIRTLPKTPSRSTRRHDLKQGRCVMGQHCENDHHAAAALSPATVWPKAAMKDGVSLRAHGGGALPHHGSRGGAPLLRAFALRAPPFSRAQRFDGGGTRHRQKSRPTFQAMIHEATHDLQRYPQLLPFAGAAPIRSGTRP